MIPFNFQLLFMIFMALFIFSATLAFIWRKNQLFSNTLTNVINAATSLFGAFISLSFILTSQPETLIFKYVIPFSLFDLSMSVDTLSAYFLLALCTLSFAVSIYSISYMKHYHGKYNLSRFGYLISLFIFSMAAVFTSSSLILFYISWEMMSVVSFFLVSYEHKSQDARSSALLYIVMTHIGAAFILLGFILMYRVNGSFDMMALENASGSVKLILLILFFIGFGMKAGLVPLHIWLPYAHPAAPANVSALMSGIMLKTAFYGMIRFCIDLIGCSSPIFGMFVMGIGVLSVVIGAVYMYLEPDFKRMLAYSSIENMGIITIGFGILCIAQANSNSQLFTVAFIAVCVHIFSHMLFKGLMFMVAGSVHYATHTRDIERLGGLIKLMPLTGVIIILGGLAMSSIVPMNGFIGEWLMIQTLFTAAYSGSAALKIIIIVALASLAIAGAFACASSVRVIGIAFLGKPRTESAWNAKEVPKPMIVAMSIFTTFCMFVGIFPTPLILLASAPLGGLSGLSLNDIPVTHLLFTPMVISGNAAAPVIALTGIIIIFTLVILGFIFNRKGLGVRKYETWNCGYYRGSTRMQYSSTGYSNPIATVFSSVFNPVENIETNKGLTPYDVKEIEYSLTNRKLFETIFYNPVKRLTLLVSNVTKATVQTGSTGAYLAYIFVFLIILLALNRIL